MLKLAFLCAALAVAYAAAAAAGPLTINDHLSASDQARLHDQIVAGIAGPELYNHFYGLLYAEPSAIAADVGGHAAKGGALYAAIETRINEFERSFYMAGSAALLKTCDHVPVPEGVRLTVEQKRDLWQSTHEVWMYLQGLRYLEEAPCDGLKVRKGQLDTTALGKALVALVRKDDSLTSLGWAFAVAAELGAASPAAVVVDWVEGAIAQADEVDGRMLQLEGGLSVTALVLNGALKLTTVLKKPVPLSAEQALKFTRYFLSRRLVQNAKGAGLLLEVLRRLASLTAVAPVCIQTIGNGQVNGDTATLAVHVCDVFGRPLAVAAAPGVVKGEVREAGKAAVAHAGDLVARDSTKSVFELRMPKLERGAYTVTVRVGAGLEQTLPVRLLAHVECPSAEIGVGETDSGASGSVRKHEVKFGQKLETALQADTQQKLWLQAGLFEAGTDDPFRVHQFFVRLEHRASGEEIIYVAELDGKLRYTFELDVGARAADFGHRSGEYVVELIVGDASLVNSFRWPLADIHLKFGEAKEVVVAKPTAGNRALKPDIAHTFRKPEPRPARFISDTFSSLCAIPFFSMLMVWAYMGVNVENFPFSLSAVGFHLGFGGILWLFGVFFVQLNMFETVRYLVPLALVTFFFGNRLLRSIAARESGGKQ